MAHLTHEGIRLRVFQAFLLSLSHGHLLCDLICAVLIEYLVFTLFICTCSFSLALTGFLRADMIFYTSQFKDSEWVRKCRGGDGWAGEKTGGEGGREWRALWFPVLASLTAAPIVPVAQP